MAVTKHCFCHHTVHGINITLSWASEGETGGLGPPWNLKVSVQKGCVLGFLWEKTKFTTFGPP